MLSARTLRLSTYFARCRPLQRNIYIQTESTPNPNSMKFLPGQIVLPESQGTGMFFSSIKDPQTKRSPLAIQLFQIEGVKGIFFGKDFISITKDSTLNWHLLNPILFSAIFDFLSSGKPVVLGDDVITDTTILDSDDEVVKAIKVLLETRIRPSVQEDGGDIKFIKFEWIRNSNKCAHSQYAVRFDCNYYEHSWCCCHAS